MKNKKSYSPPQIKKYGSAAQLVEANTFNGVFRSDGGTTGTNLYAS